MLGSYLSFSQCEIVALLTASLRPSSSPLNSLACLA